MNNTPSAAPQTAAADAPDPRRWGALVVLLTGTFLPPLDFFIVNVALPSIRTDLNTDAATVQLVISGYAAAYAVLLILGGRLGDLYGRRRVFVAGLLGFAASSALCGFAWSPTVLIVGRVLQGCTAAIMAPQSLASIHALFPAKEKARALGFYGATFGLASVAGQMLGGALIAANPFGLGWRSVFLVNLPVVAIAVPGALVLLRESQARQSSRLDRIGVVLLAVALSALVVPLIEGRERGWPIWAIVLLIAFLPLMRLFWRHEQHVVHRGGDPLVVPALLNVPGLCRGLAATLFFYALAAFFLTFSVYEQAGLGRTPLNAGLAILPLAIGFLLGPLTSPWFSRRFGNKTPAVGMLLEATGLFGVAAVVVLILPSALSPALFLIGLGQGIALPTLVRAVVDRVENRWAGLAAGLVNSVLQISAALAVALIGGLFYAVLGARSDTAAIEHAFAISTVAIGAALVVAAFLISSVRQPAQAVVSEP